MCQCKDCKAWRKHDNKILGKRLLKHLGPGAYFVSDYQKYKRDKRGKIKHKCKLSF